jgi:guanylate kinase
MSKYKILALIGEAGSGKDTLMQRILAKAPGLHEIVSCTTREPREGEIHGKNYFFLTEEEFTQKVLSKTMSKRVRIYNFLINSIFVSNNL